MSFWTYMLRCADGSYYVGHTDDIDVRIADHHAGGMSVYTRKRRPLTVVLVELYGSRDEAFARERQLKGWSRAKKEALLKGNVTRLQALARQL
jgi:tRNA/rRNA methyltransferase